MKLKHCAIYYLLDGNAFRNDDDPVSFLLSSDLDLFLALRKTTVSMYIVGSPKVVSEKSAEFLALPIIFWVDFFPSSIFSFFMPGLLLGFFHLLALVSL